MSAKKLLLFDIDGTLVDTGGTGFPALQMSLKDGFQIDDDMAYLSLAGATDTGICHDILEHHGIDSSPANIAKLIDGYLYHLRQLIPSKEGRVLPGILNLLQGLQQRPDLVMALLTGNVNRGAEIKLGHYGLWHFFEFGAFADDHHIRDRLGPFATARALEKHGVVFLPENTYVIGDTPKDIACGRAFGAVTVAVATGSYSAKQLAEHRPDFVFEDFSDADLIIATLEW